MALITESRAGTGSARFTRFAWAVLAWNLLVILWGAYVRASSSGAGCGSHWPLCNGEVIPIAPRIETIIEFTHRITSGVALIAVVALAWWSVAAFPRGHRVRRAAMLSILFIALEALLGAGIVLLQFVGDNQSVGRAIYLSLHLVNTQFLLAALALTAWYSRGAAVVRPSRLIVAALPIAILVSITGAIAALGDTLFPASSLVEGMRQDLSAAAHFLVRLRVVHPVLAVLAGVYFGAVAIRMLHVSRVALWVLILTLAQLAAGAINLMLLAPIGMQIVHLLVADLLWISLVLAAAPCYANRT